MSIKPDKVEITYAKTPRNCLHLYLTAATGTILLPYEIRAQTIKLVGCRVVQKNANDIPVMFFQSDFIGANQTCSNTGMNSIPLIYNSTVTDSNSSVSFEMQGFRMIKHRLSYNLVNQSGVLVTDPAFVQIIFEYEIAEIM